MHFYKFNLYTNQLSTHELFRLCALIDFKKKKAISDRLTNESEIIKYTYVKSPSTLQREKSAHPHLSLRRRIIISLESAPHTHKRRKKRGSYPNQSNSIYIHIRPQSKKKNRDSLAGDLSARLIRAARPARAFTIKLIFISSRP